MKEVKKQSRRIIRDPLDVHVGKEKKEANRLEQVLERGTGGGWQN